MCLLTCFLTLMIVVGCDGCGSSSVTLDAGEGVQLETTTIELSKGDEYTLPTPTRVGYIFKGWKNGEENITISGLWNTKGDVTLTAKWESKTYNLTLDTQGGQLDNSTLPVAFGESFTLPIPTKDGNQFLGWKYNGEVIQDGIWNIDLDGVVLVAEWNPSSTKITFDLSGGTFLNTTETTANVLYGTEYTFPIVYNGLHKTLKCWKDLKTGQEFYIDSLDKAWKVKDAEITLTAIWRNDTHVVSVNLDGATEFDCELEQKVECGTEFVLPTVAKEGYTFVGWYVGETKVETPTLIIESDVKLVAKWEKYKTTVKYNVQGLESDLIEYGTPYTLKTLGSEYYGWRNSTTKQYIPYTGEKWFVEASEITLEPVAIADVCFVKFTGDYVSIADKVFTKGEIVSTPTVDEAKPGHVFEGWTMKGSEILINFNNPWASTGNVELVAKWKAKNFTISFDANGGKFNDGSSLLENKEIVSFGESYDFNSYTPELAGYKFIGWAYNEKLLAPIAPIENDMFSKGLIILPKDYWNFDGINNITLKAIYISLDTGFGPQV